MLAQPLLATAKKAKHKIDPVFFISHFLLMDCCYLWHTDAAPSEPIKIGAKRFAILPSLVSLKVRKRCHQYYGLFVPIRQCKKGAEKLLWRLLSDERWLVMDRINYRKRFRPGQAKRVIPSSSAGPDFLIPEPFLLPQSF